MKITETYLFCIILFLFVCENDGQLSSNLLCIKLLNFKICIPILSGLLSEFYWEEIPEIDSRPGECLSYNVLNEADRSTSSGVNLNWCDNANPDQYVGKGGIQSPGWVGSAWYRIILPGGRPGGSKIPDELQSLDTCGTRVGGYLSTVGHPQTVGQSKDVTFCFGWPATDKSCEWSTQGRVTHCGDFYVYYLPDTPFCRLRYCATN